MTEEQWKRMGMRIRDIRLQRKISLKAIESMTQLCDCTICNIETGKFHPALETVVRIVTALDVSLDYIVLGVHPLVNRSGLIFRSDDELDESLFLAEE